MDIQKFLLLLVFCFSGYLLVDAWQKEHQPPEVTQAPISAESASLPAPLTRAGEDKAIPPAELKVGAVAGEKITVITDYLIAEINTLGGDLHYLEFTQHRATEDKKKNFVLLQNDAKHIYITQSGLLGEGLPNHKTHFAAEATRYQLAQDQDSLTVRMSTITPRGDKITKSYTFRKSSYLIEVGFEITNAGSADLQTDAYYQIVRDSTSPAGSSKLMPTYTGMAFYTDSNKFSKISFSDVEKNKAPPRTVDNGWVAMVQHYFISAWVAPEKTHRELYFKKQGEGLYATGVIVPIEKIKPGTTVKANMQLYAGPEEQDKLIQIAPGLERTTDYGWLTVIAKPLFWVLQKIHGGVGNWGIAIILLTVIIKLIFYPLSAASYKSMARMRLLTPKLQKLREQYGSERQKLHLAMVGLYKVEKVNPLGGCLPIVVQIPVFIALYWVLLAAVELRHAPFFLWIQDLSAPDPYFILPVIMGASMFIQTWLNPTPPDPIQAKIMKIMPIAFSVFFFFFPAGLVLYWVVNNILSIAQQWQITRAIERAQPARGKS